MAENLQWRIRTRKLALDSKEYQALLLAACKEDILFFFDAFTWTADPREESATFRPFILWECQEKAVLDVNAAIANSPLCIEKSRAMGGTWLCLTVFAYHWLFGRDKNFIVASMKAENVYKLGDAKALFTKITQSIDRLPPWMAPRPEEYILKEMFLGHPTNGCTITGEATTSDLNRSGRATAVFLDEAAAMPNLQAVRAATVSVSNCTIFCSTPGSRYDEFGHIANDEPDIKKTRLIWRDSPLYMKGAYTGADGVVRSPWYDKQCVLLGHNKQLIARELEISYLSSEIQAFAPEIVEAMLVQCKEPVRRVALDIVGDGPSAGVAELADIRGGPLRLWCPIGADMKAPPGRYALGADVSFGVGKSSSTVCVINMDTSECVATLDDAHIRPHDFLKTVVAIGRMFRNATLVWETGGPSSSWAHDLMKVYQYPNLYRRLSREDSRSPKKTDAIGIPTEYKAKNRHLASFISSIHQRKLKIYDWELVNEMKSYILGSARIDGFPQIVHSRAAHSNDPLEAGTAHGDRVIAASMAHMVWIESVRSDPTISGKPRIQPGSMADRMQSDEALALAFGLPVKSPSGAYRFGR